MWNHSCNFEDKPETIVFHSLIHSKDIDNLLFRPPWSCDITSLSTWQIFVAWNYNNRKFNPTVNQCCPEITRLTE